jgi:hypothetical protein
LVNVYQTTRSYNPEDNIFEIKVVCSFLLRKFQS